MRLLKKIWIQLRDCYLFFFRGAIILNGYVDDFTWLGIRHRNWGDDLNYYMLGLLTKKPVVLYHNFWVAKKLQFQNYLCIGTLLDAVNYSNKNTIVWGSGHSGQNRDFVMPQKICSVRGPKTRALLLEKGIACPEQLGDPALILPLVYQPKDKTKKYKLGIIPHVIDQQHPFVQSILHDHPDVLLIDLAKYGKWTDVIDQICSCDCIASSSLHGLIVSDTYGVPNCWIELTGNISGGLFKFYDYAESVNRMMGTPIHVDEFTGLTYLIGECGKWTQPEIDREAILDSCPFPIEIK